MSSALMCPEDSVFFQASIPTGSYISLTSPHRSLSRRVGFDEDIPFRAERQAGLNICNLWGRGSDSDNFLRDFSRKPTENNW